MIDYFALTLVHVLLIIGLFRMVQDDALDPLVKLPQRKASHKKKPQVRRKAEAVHPSKRSDTDTAAGDGA
ncbi:MAG: hypothetical protein ABJP34_04065 [Erythrobacter sp.]